MSESNSTSRINIRVTPEEKLRINQLSDMNHLSVSKLLVTSILNPFLLDGVQNAIIEEHNKTIVDLYQKIEHLLPPKIKNDIMKECEKLWIQKKSL